MYKKKLRKGKGNYFPMWEVFCASRGKKKCPVSKKMGHQAVMVKRDLGGKQEK